MQLALLTLASKFSIDPLRIKALLEEQKLLTPLRINRHTADGSTRVELFDLVQGMITGSIYHKFFGGQGNRISLTKAVHRRMYKVLSMTPELDDRAEEYQDIFITSAKGSEEKRQIFAACGSLRLEDKFGGLATYTDQRFISLAELSLFEEFSGQPLRLTCDDQRYELAIEKLKAEPLPLPPPYNILSYADSGEVQILLTYAFSNETDAKLLAGIVSYLATKGYYLNPVSDIRRGVNTQEEFKKAFAKSDIYIPAAHLLDLNTFELGTERSTVMTFTKNFRHKSGTTLKAKVTAFFPVKGSGGAKSLNRGDLAQLLSERRLQNPHSLFVLTTSCNASDAISTWTSAYRQSLEFDMAAGRRSGITDAKDLIHAIAPEGSFPTSSPSELLMDFIGPLESVRIVFEGGQPQDVYEYLKQDIKPDRFVKFIQKIESLVTRKKKSLQPIQFIPRYNLAEQGLLDQKGFDYTLRRSELENPNPPE